MSLEEFCMLNFEYEYNFGKICKRTREDQTFVKKTEIVTSQKGLSRLNFFCFHTTKE